jgi:hypothetical protein
MTSWILSSPDLCPAPAQKPRRRHAPSAAAAEVIVDTVTFIVCGALGPDISGSSVLYASGWGEGNGALDAIQAYAKRSTSSPDAPRTA